MNSFAGLSKPRGKLWKEEFKATQVDAAARSLIDSFGYGKAFSHGLGHGIGLYVHEGPRISSLSQDSLALGDVFTLEPGIYLEGPRGAPNRG